MSQPFLLKSGETYLTFSPSARKDHQPQIHWALQNTLDGPDQDGVTRKLVALTCFTKLEHRLRSVLLIYEHQVKFVVAHHCSAQTFIFFFRILNIDTLSTIREYYLPGLMFVLIFLIAVTINELS